MSDLDMIYGSKPSPTQPKTEEKTQKALTSKHVSNKVSKQESKTISNDASKQVSIEESILALLDTRNLKGNTFRYTQEELDFIRDVTYEASVKYKTQLDKNDVARIGLEWLMQDWNTNKEESLLAKILTSKKARK